MGTIGSRTIGMRTIGMVDNWHAENWHGGQLALTFLLVSYLITLMFYTFNVSYLITLFIYFHTLHNKF